MENMQQIIQTISNTLQSPVLAYKVAAARVCDIAIAIAIDIAIDMMNSV